MNGTVEIRGRVYTVGALTPMKQFHVARRLAPLLQAFASSAEGALDDLAQVGGVGLGALTPFEPSQGSSDSEAPPSEEASEGAAGEEAAPGAFKQLLSYVGPVLERLAEMSDEDTEYVLTTCLSACLRQDRGGWAPVVSPQGQLMFSDMNALEMLQLAQEVIKHNLADFFPDAPTPS